MGVLFVSKPIEVGTFSDVNKRECKVTVTSPSGFLEISRDGETRLLLTIEEARELARGIAFAEKALGPQQDPTITAENDPDSRVHCSNCGEYIRNPMAVHEICDACLAKEART